MAGKIPRRGFFGTWVYLFQKHLGLLALFVCCIAVVAHIVLTALPPFQGIGKSDTLAQLIKKTERLGVGSSPGPVVTIAGVTLNDENDWLNPMHLGLRPIQRPPSGLLGFDPALWSPKLVSVENGKTTPAHALPTNAWWQLLVMSPGTGAAHSINQHPYSVSVISKQESHVLSSTADRAGLQILAPYTEVINSADGSVFGVQQSQGRKAIGFVMGVKLVDLGDFVESHFVESYGPLEVVKRWNMSTFQRDANGTAMMDREKLHTYMRSRIVRGSSFISMELPVGVFFILDSVPQDSSKGLANAIVKIADLGAAPADPQFTCAGLSKEPMTSDAIEITLSDKTRWVVVFDQKVSLSCVPSPTSDRLLSSSPLKAPLMARLAITDLTAHADVASGALAGMEKMKGTDWTKRSSAVRWSLMSHIKKTSASSVAKFVTQINKENSDIHKALRSTFTQFPLRDQLDKLSKTLEFELLTVRWNEHDINQILNDKDPSIIIFPENFIEDPRAFWISEDFKNGFNSYQVSTRGRTVLGIGGTQFGSIPAFFDKALNIGIQPLTVINSQVDKKINRMKEIKDTGPANTESNSVAEEFLARSMPPQLPVTSKNKIELIAAHGGGWPFVTYCRPSSLGSGAQNEETCDGAAHVYFYTGRGSVQWIGLDWSQSLEADTSAWVQVLARSIISSGCTEGMRSFPDPYNQPGGVCSAVKRVLLINDVDAARQEELLKDLTTAIVVKGEVKLANGTLVERDVVDLPRTLSFLKGTKDEQTGNIGAEMTTMTDPDTESHRDFILRHALMVPVASGVDVEMHDTLGMIHYLHEMRGLQGFQKHSLYPAMGMNTSDLLWDPYRSAVYLTELQRRMEYKTGVGRILQLTNPSLEDDETTCLPSVVGALCLRSFGPAPDCRMPEFVPGGETEDSRKKLCTFAVDGSLDRNSWDINQLHADLNAGRSVLFTHLHDGSSVGIKINFPVASWDLPVRTETGLYRSLIDGIHPYWQSKIRWAVSEDVSGSWRLDGNVWADAEAADDLSIWVRMIHRYAQIALAAEAVGLRNEQKTAVDWLKAGLLKFFNNRFDNKGLMYDSTYGGIVPCGCDRDISGESFCVPPPRMSYLTETNQSKGMTSWMAIGCPALANPKNENGAGYFADHHSLWGHVVYSAAVAAKFDPTFPNVRVRLQTAGGVRRPKIHHLVMALIMDYANPMLVEPFTSVGVLQRYFPGARHKDWWRLHSYGTGVGTADSSGPAQHSVSEAAFSYWAASLYAGTVGDVELQKWAQLLTGTELVSGNAFWHIKEYSETVPVPLRYLGAIGRVGESSVSFQTQFSVASFEVFHSQILPLNLLSFESLEPGWVLWMAQRWQSACQQDPATCAKSGADLGVKLISMLASDWEAMTEVASLSAESRLDNSTKGIDDALIALANIPCFQMGSYNCGSHTLSNSVFWTALAYTWGGANGELNRQDGNGRYQVY